MERTLVLDKEGIQKVMRKRDYVFDMTGQLGLGIMANIVGQLTYFYTDKIGVAAAGVGVCLLIAKIIDAFTDVWAGSVIDNTKGGNEKYIKWMGRMMVPAALTVFFLFTVPSTGSSNFSLFYILLTNLLLTAVFYTFIATPYSALMVVRTKSQTERGLIGLSRAAANYATGTILTIAIIPITNILGGNQAAWMQFGAGAAVVTFISFAICYFTLRKSDLSGSSSQEQQEEEHQTPFKEALGLLFRNKYWVIVLVFNLLISIHYAISASAGVYYMKWIFGNDNLVGIVGLLSMIPTLLGFVLAGPIISKLGVKKTIRYSLALGIISGLIKCIFPTDFNINVGSGLLATFTSIPLMSLFGVLTAMTIDYNELIYGKKMVAMSSGAIGFGSKVGNGLGVVLLTLLLSLGKYDASLAAATPSMRVAIYAFSNWIPLIIYVVLFLLFTKFDVEEKIASLRAVKETNG